MVTNPALAAAKNGDLSYLQSLSGLNDGLTDRNGANCLHYAARGGQVDVLKYLIKNCGFNESKRSNVGSTAAHDAAATGQINALKWLLNNTSLPVNDQDGTGATTCHLAARYGHVHALTWLLDDTDADPMLKCASGSLPIHFAVSGQSLNTVELLLKETPRAVNLQTVNGASPLYLACQAGSLDIAKVLVSKNATAKIKCYDGMSCLHAAAQMGHLDCVKWLVEDQKFNANDRDFDGATPLHFAASRGHVKVIEWLMQRGGAKVTMDNLGGTPLHNAAELGLLQCVKTLLANGCDADITDNQGLTAADLAEKCHHSDCAAEVQAHVTVVSEYRLNLDLGRPPEPDITHPPTPPPLPTTYQDNPQTQSIIGNQETFSSNLTHIFQPGPYNPPLPNPTFSEILKASCYNRSVSQEVHCGQQFEQEPSNSPLEARRNPPGGVHFYLSQETEGCESTSSSSPQHSPLGSCKTEGQKDSLGRRRQISHPDFNIPLPPELPVQDTRQRSGSDISSVVSSLSSEENSSINVLERGSISTQNQRLSASRSPEALHQFHQQELLKAIQFRRMNSEAVMSEDSDRVQESKNIDDLNDHVKKLNMEEDKKVVNGQNGISATGIDDDGQNGSVSVNGGIHPSTSSDSPALTVPLPPPPPIPPPPPTQCFPAMNGDVHKPQRPNSLIAQEGRTSSSPGSAGVSPMTGSQDLIEELKKAAAGGNSNLRKTRKPQEGQATMICSFGSSSSLNRSEKSSANSSRSVSPASSMRTSQTSTNGIPSNKAQPVVIEVGSASRSPALPSKTQQGTGTKVPSASKSYVTSAANSKSAVNSSQPKSVSSKSESNNSQSNSESKGDNLDPKSFLDQIPRDMPEWRRQLLARQMAEKAKKEAEEQRKKDEEANKYAHLPPWKRQMMERKDAEAKAAEEKLLQQQQMNAKKTGREYPGGKVPPWQKS